MLRYALPHSAKNMIMRNAALRRITNMRHAA
jgi:hypothetical protein